VNRVNDVRLDSCIASCAKKFCACAWIATVAGIISLAVDHIYYIQNYRCVYHNYIPDSAVFFDIYRIWFTTILNFLKTAAQKCKPTRRFTCSRQDILWTSFNEKENACRLLHMKTILPFRFPRNVLANELIRIHCFGRQEQVLQDQSIQPLKQKPYYIKSRWTVYYI